MSDPSSQSEPARQAVSSQSRLAELLRPHAFRMVAACLMLIGLTAVNIVLPQLVAIVFNDVFPNGYWGLLFTVLVGMLGLYALRNVLYFGGKYISVMVGENVCFVLRRRLFERLQHMSLRYHRKNQAGQLSSRVMNDSFVVQQFIQDELPTLLQAVLLFLGIVATIYAMNWQLALAATIVLPLHIAAYYYFRKPIKDASSISQHHLADATGNLIEKLLGIEVVKGFAGEERENQAFEQAINRSRRSELRGKRYHVIQKVMADLLVGLGLIFLIGFGAYQVMGKPADQALAPGDFIAFFWYIRMLYPTVLDMMSGSAKFARASAGLDRVNDVLSLVPDEPEDKDALETPFRGGVTFEQVYFAYPEGPNVLKGVHFNVEPGQVCAILGSSGVGKSTLVSLVPRLNIPGTGRLLIDGEDIQRYALSHVRISVGMAFQEPFLFRSTVLENLRYAKPTATREQIVETAQRVGIHEFITSLPKGYDTVVGDSGLSLSRGQKQQITLARALLKEPKILILDEATSSIDEATEALVLPRVLKFMQGKTTLMVTHRPALLKYADKVIHLVDGTIMYDGPVSGFDRESFVANPQPVDEGSVPDISLRRSGGGGLNQTLNLLAVGLLCLASMIFASAPAVAAESAPKDAAPPAKAQQKPG